MKQDLRYWFYYLYYRVWLQPQFFKVTKEDYHYIKGVPVPGHWVEHRVLSNMHYFVTGALGPFWWLSIHNYFMSHSAFRTSWKLTGIQY